MYILRRVQFALSFLSLGVPTAVFPQQVDIYRVSGSLISSQEVPYMPANVILDGASVGQLERDFLRLNTRVGVHLLEIRQPNADVFVKAFVQEGGGNTNFYFAARIPKPILNPDSLALGARVKGAWRLGGYSYVPVTGPFDTFTMTLDQVDGRVTGHGAAGNVRGTSQFEVSGITVPSTREQSKVYLVLTSGGAPYAAFEASIQQNTMATNLWRFRGEGTVHGFSLQADTTTGDSPQPPPPIAPLPPRQMRVKAPMGASGAVAGAAAFLAAVAANRVDDMGAYWGSRDGPARETNKPADWRLRMEIVRQYLLAELVTLDMPGSPDPQTGRVQLPVSWSRDDCTATVEFTMLQDKKGRWMVNSFDLRVLPKPDNPCRAGSNRN